MIRHHINSHEENHKSILREKTEKADKKHEKEKAKKEKDSINKGQQARKNLL